MISPKRPDRGQSIPLEKKEKPQTCGGDTDDEPNQIKAKECRDDDEASSRLIIEPSLTHSSTKSSCLHSVDSADSAGSAEYSIRDGVFEDNSYAGSSTSTSFDGGSRDRTRRISLYDESGSVRSGSFAAAGSVGGMSGVANSAGSGFGMSASSGFGASEASTFYDEETVGGSTYFTVNSGVQSSITGYTSAYDDDERGGMEFQKGLSHLRDALFEFARLNRFGRENDMLHENARNNDGNNDCAEQYGLYNESSLSQFGYEVGVDHDNESNPNVGNMLAANNKPSISASKMNNKANAESSNTTSSFDKESKQNQSEIETKEKNSEKGKGSQRSLPALNFFRRKPKGILRKSRSSAVSKNRLVQFKVSASVEKSPRTTMLACDTEISKGKAASTKITSVNERILADCGEVEVHLAKTLTQGGEQKLDADKNATLLTRQKSYVARKTMQPWKPIVPKPSTLKNRSRSAPTLLLKRQPKSNVKKWRLSPNLEMFQSDITAEQLRQKPNSGTVVDDQLLAPSLSMGLRSGLSETRLVPMNPGMYGNGPIDADAVVPESIEKEIAENYEDKSLSDGKCAQKGSSTNDLFATTRKMAVDVCVSSICQVSHCDSMLNGQEVSISHLYNNSATPMGDQSEESWANEGSVVQLTKDASDIHRSGASNLLEGSLEDDCGALGVGDFHGVGRNEEDSAQDQHEKKAISTTTHEIIMTRSDNSLEDTDYSLVVSDSFMANVLDEIKLEESEIKNIATARDDEVGMMVNMSVKDPLDAKCDQGGMDYDLPEGFSDLVLEMIAEEAVMGCFEDEKKKRGFPSFKLRKRL